MSHVFGKGSLGGLIGDVIGGGLGFLAGGPVGGIIGAGLGGGIGTAAGGGNLGQDILGGALGAGLATGTAELAGADVLGLGTAGAAGAGAAGSAGAVGADTAATFADSLVPATTGVGGAVDTGAFDVAAAAPVATAAPGVTTAADLAAPVASSIPSTTSGLTAGAFAPATQQAALGVDLTSAPSTAFSTAPAAAAGTGAATTGTTALGVGATSGPLGASEATFVPATFTPSTFGLQASDLASPALNSGGFFSGVGNAIGKVGDVLASPTGRVLSTGVAGLGLLRDLMTPSTIPGQGQLQALATQLGQEGSNLVGANAPGAQNVAGQATQQASVLENYLNTGTLPPAIQSALDQATNSAITNLKAQYAARGESADPNQNSQLQAEITAIRQNAVIQGGTLAASLFSQGVGLDQLASSIYTNLVGQGTGAQTAATGAQGNVVAINQQLTNQTNQGIANLATALGGANRPVQNPGTIIA